MDGVRESEVGVHSTEDNQTPWHGPCASAPRRPADEPPHQSWDLDVGDGQSWIRAIRICAEECPVRALCIQARKEHYPHSNPSAVIWAGVAYSDTGKVLGTDGLRRLAAANRGKQQLRSAGQNQVAG